MTEEELQTALEKTTPDRECYGLFVEECQDQDIRVRFSAVPGEGWSVSVRDADSLASSRRRRAPSGASGFGRRFANFVCQPDALSRSASPPRR